MSVLWLIVITFATVNLVYFVDSDTLHILSRGDILFFGEQEKMNLTTAEERCSKMYGQLPIVHSKDFAGELSRILGQGNYAWLGTKKLNISSSLQPRVYEWSDGSDFDFNEWWGGQPTCQSACCGVSLIAKNGGQLYDEPCRVLNQFICIIHSFSNESDSEWWEHELTKVTPNNSSEAVALFERTFALDLLHQLVHNLQEETLSRNSHFQRIESALSLVNSSLLNKHKQLRDNLKNSSAETSIALELYSNRLGESESKLSSLGNWFHCFLVLFVFVTIGTLLTVLTRSRLIPFFPHRIYNFQASFAKNDRENLIPSESSISNLSSASCSTSDGGVTLFPKNSISSV